MVEHVPYLGDGGGSGDSIARIEWFAEHPGTGWRPCDGRIINATAFTEMVEAGWSNANGVTLPTLANSANANGLVAYIYVSGPNETPVWNTNATLPEASSYTPMNLQLSATDPDGSAISYTLANGAISNGLTLYANGLLYGNSTQTTSTVYNFTVRATDADGLYTDRTFTQSIVTKPVLRYIGNSVAVPEAKANSTSYGYQIMGAVTDRPVFYLDRAMSTGKWYWEHKFTSNYILPGVTNRLAEESYGGYNGVNVISLYSLSFGINNWGTGAGNLAITPSTNDIIGWCLDADARSLTIRVNNSISNTYNFPGGKNGPFYAYFAYQGAANQMIQLGLTGCTYAAPSGYSYL